MFLTPLAEHCICIFSRESSSNRDLHGLLESKAEPNHRITESQNIWGWKGPLWVTQPNPLPKQGHPEQAAEDLVQAGLEYLQRRRLHSLPGQPGPGLRHPQREEVLPRVQLKLPLLQFVPKQLIFTLPLEKAVLGW